MTREEKERLIKEVLSDINVSKAFFDQLIPALIRNFYLTKEKKDIRERISSDIIYSLKKVAKKFLYNIENLEVKRKEIINEEFAERTIKQSYIKENYNYE